MTWNHNSIQPLSKLPERIKNEYINWNYEKYKFNWITIIDEDAGALI